MKKFDNWKNKILQILQKDKFDQDTLVNCLSDYPSYNEIKENLEIKKYRGYETDYINKDMLVTSFNSYRENSEKINAGIYDSEKFYMNKN